MNRAILWLLLGALVVLGEQLFGVRHNFVTAGLMVIAAAVFIGGLIFDRSRKRNLEIEMKLVDDVMRKRDLSQ